MMNSVSIILVVGNALHVFHQINVVGKNWQSMCYFVQLTVLLPSLFYIKQGVVWITSESPNLLVVVTFSEKILSPDYFFFGGGDRISITVTKNVLC